MKSFEIIFGAVIGVLILIVFAFGAASETGYLPSANTLEGEAIPKRHYKKLKKANIILAEEKIHFFYSSGLFSILEDGNLYTDKRVVSYQTIEDELEVYQAYYDEIKNLQFMKSDEFWGSSEIKVTKKDDSWFILIVDNEYARDEKFFEQLHKLWLSKNSN